MKGIGIGRYATVAAAMLAALGTAHAQDTKPLDTKVTDVVVFADRAQVTRSGGVDLGAAGGQVVVEGLPGWIDHESVRVTLEPASRGRIVDVVPETAFLAKASEESVRKAEESVQELTDRLTELNDERQVLQAEVKQLEAVRAFSLDKIPRDMVTRPVKPQSFGETIDFVSDRLRRVNKALRDLDRKIRDIQPELAKRQRERNQLLTRTKLQHTRLTIGVTGTGKADIVVTYLTPGATWEPVAELRTSGGKTATLIQLASVVQTTGEDWTGAKLSFSTQRPGETLAVPEAEALLLGGGSGLGDVMQRMGASFGKANDNYMTQNRIFANDNAEWNANMARQQTIQTRALASFTALQSRGTTAHFVARSDRTVRADGRPVRVPIAEGQFAIEARTVAVPEVSLNAVRTAELVNTAELAILPGSAALFADGAFVGKTELPFVAPGETFKVFLGVNDRIKLERMLDRKRSSIDRGKKRTELKVSFLITAENLGKSPVTLELTDRVPVVQDEDIELDGLKIPEEAKQEPDGLIRWQATLKPGEKKTWRIEYELEYATGLATRSESLKEQLQKGRSPSSPAPARMLFDDIKQLEKSF